MIRFTLGRLCQILCLCVLALGLFACAVLPPADDETITVFVPLFSQVEPSLGRNINRAIQIQFLASPVLPKSFSEFIFVSKDRIFYERGHELPITKIQFVGGAGRRFIRIRDQSQVFKVAQDYEGASLLVLWGEAIEYGDGVVLLTQLSIPDVKTSKSKELQTWRVDLAGGDQQLSFVVDLPSRRLTFAPAVLTKSFIDEYSPDKAFNIYRESTANSVVGTLRIGEDFQAPMWQPKGSSDLLYVEKISENVSGWVKVPLLSGTLREIIDIVKGIADSQMGRWRRADKLFERAIENKATPTELKFNLYLYSAFAKEKAGETALDELYAALRLNPYSDKTAAYLMMSHLAELSRLMKSDAKEEERLVSVSIVKTLINRYKGIFSHNDPWLAHLQQNMPKIEALAAAGT